MHCFVAVSDSAWSVVSMRLWFLCSGSQRQSSVKGVILSEELQLSCNLSSFTYTVLFFQFPCLIFLFLESGKSQLFLPRRMEAVLFSPCCWSSWYACRNFVLGCCSDQFLILLLWELRAVSTSKDKQGRNHKQWWVRLMVKRVNCTCWYYLLGQNKF